MSPTSPARLLQNNMLTFAPFIAQTILESEVNFIITGASGWLGSANLEMLERVLGSRFKARVRAFGSHARTLKLRSGSSIPCEALEDIGTVEWKNPIYLHYAFLTKEKTDIQPLEAFVAGNEVISKQVKSAITKTGTRGIFLPSSGAVYLPDSRMIDRDLKGNPYGVMKARDEIAFYHVAEALETKLVIARIFNLAGPFINKQEHYALSSMLLSALAGKPITIRAAHRVLRSYAHIEDVLNLAFALLFDESAKSPFLFDTAGEKPVELSELADDILSVLEQSHNTIHRPVIKQTGEDVYLGWQGEMMALMDRYGLTPHTLQEQISDTAEFLKTA